MYTHLTKYWFPWVQGHSKCHDTVVHGVLNRIVYPTVYSWNFCSEHAVYTVFYKTFHAADDQDVWAFGGHSNVQYIFTMLRVSLSGRPIDVRSSAP